MKAKITKEQREAIEYLSLDIDELMDKPRRLFGSLTKFADWFLPKKLTPPLILLPPTKWTDSISSSASP